MYLQTQNILKYTETVINIKNGFNVIRLRVIFEEEEKACFKESLSTEQHKIASAIYSKQLIEVENKSTGYLEAQRTPEDLGLEIHGQKLQMDNQYMSSIIGHETIHK